MNKDKGLLNAREKALMAEEKWLIENLKKIRKQRHDLDERIEYFQHMQSRVFEMHNAQFGHKYFKTDSDKSNSRNAGGEGSSQYAGFTRNEQEPEIPEPVNGTDPSNIDDFNLVEASCNEIESLNLNVTPDNNPSMNMMETENDSEVEKEDEGNPDWANIQFDMSLVVSGQCNNFKTAGNE